MYWINYTKNEFYSFRLIIMEYKILFKISLGIRRDRSLYVKFKIQEFLNN